MLTSNRRLRRILTDSAGYLLLVAALLTGWLPGPGGIPLALAGLGLLSVHNAWARRLRIYLLTHGSTIARRLFLDNPGLQLAYDIVVLALLGAASIIFWRRGDTWQVALGGSLCISAISIGLLNRRRGTRLVNRLKHKY